MKAATHQDMTSHPALTDLDTMIPLIQALIPLGLQAFAEVMQAEIAPLAGPKYSRTGGQPNCVRWGRQPGSIFLADQKVPVPVQRVRDQARRQELPLQSYQQLQTPRRADGGLFRKVLAGLSCRDYAASAEAVPEAFGLSASSVSRRFIRASAKQLQAFQERRLDDSVFGAQTPVQRCQWHKRENVVAYLPEGHRGPWRRKLQAAYQQPTYAEAKAALLRQALRTAVQGGEETAAIQAA